MDGLLSDLNRCVHGRHAGDRCEECPDGTSAGNLWLKPGQRIGTGMLGQPLVVPGWWCDENGRQP